MHLDRSMIEAAGNFLHGKIRQTPLERSYALEEILGVPAWLKLENLQLTGSFKIRGAWFRLQQLSAEQRARGVASCSAGNHGLALAYGGSQLKIPVTIYVPRSVDEAKFKGMRVLGATVIRSEFDGFDDTEPWAIAQAESEKLLYVSAFDDIAIMAGNGGSLAQEISLQCPQAQHVVVPVGGGGLIAGLSHWFDDSLINVHACQLQDSSALKPSLEKGQAVTRLPAIQTLAGGLEGGLGQRTFEVIRRYPPQSVSLIKERELYEAVRWLLAEHRYLMEPSSAVTVAAALSKKLPVMNGPIVFVISGRNVSLESLQKVLSG